MTVPAVPGPPAVPERPAVPECPAVPRSRIRVGIVDDHRMVLTGLATWLQEAADDIDVVLAVPSWTDLLAAQGNSPVDVVLLDLYLGDDVPASMKIATLRSTGAAVVMVSALADPAKLRECVAAGALGYVPKTEPAEEIVAAIRAAADGTGHVTPALAAALAHTEQAEGLPRPGLSQRESRALVLYASDLPMKTVGSRMGVSPETAKSYIDRVRAKYARLGREARTKLELYRRAVEDGLLAEDKH